MLERERGVVQVGPESFGSFKQGRFNNDVGVQKGNPKGDRGKGVSRWKEKDLVRSGNLYGVVP